MGFIKKTSFLLMMGIALSHCAQYPQLRDGTTYAYQYTRGRVEIGTEVFSLEKKGSHSVMRSDLHIREANSHQWGNSELVFRKNGKPVAYSRHLDVTLPEIPAQNGIWELRYVFQGKKVTGEVTKDGLPQWKGIIEVERGGVYCIDNNALSLLAILVKATYPELRKKTIYSVKAFHCSEARVRDVTFRKVNGGTYHCRIEGIDVGDLSIRDGIVLKHEDPRRGLVIRLMK
jgi:hypothetical protein